jgi:hypothetical protein
VLVQHAKANWAVRTRRAEQHRRCTKTYKKLTRFATLLPVVVQRRAVVHTLIAAETGNEAIVSIATW